MMHPAAPTNRDKMQNLTEKWKVKQESKGEPVMEQALISWMEYQTNNTFAEAIVIYRIFLSPSDI